MELAITTLTDMMNTHLYSNKFKRSCYTKYSPCRDPHSVIPHVADAIHAIHHIIAYAPHYCMAAFFKHMENLRINELL